MGHHQLFEWEARRFDAPNAITVREAELLMRAAQAPSARLKGKPKAFEHGRETFKAQHLFGIVAAAGISCEILPKVDRDAPGDAPQLRRQLVRMLAVAHDIPAVDDAATSVDLQNETLLEILIARFIAMLDEALRRGLPRAYRQHQEDLPALRGTLDVTRQFSTLAASPHRLACRYDEFTVNIPFNQIVKAAVAKLRQLARKIANQQALTDLGLLYGEVSNVPAVALAWQEVVAGRGNISWMPLIRLARLILGDRFQNSSHGSADGFALLFDMNALFERYVEKLLGPIASAEGWLMKPQGGGNSCLHPEDGTNALFATYPDIQLLRGDRVGMIVDTKWKRLIDRTYDPKMDVKQNDIYQMMAYAHLYNCDNLVLLYPHHGGLTSAMPVRHHIAAPDGRTMLTVASIDLTDHASARHALSKLPW